jgi:beta-glucosidase/6-phospho-beta-glucosidase/beta-galactosidase
MALTGGGRRPSCSDRGVVHAPRSPEIVQMARRKPLKAASAAKPASDETGENQRAMNALRFMFAVGIECSAPIAKDGRRVDQLEATGHYEQWEKDLGLVRELGLQYLRYGLPIHRVFRGPRSYDWSFADRVLERMRELGIVPILDLVHFGLPDWLGSFQNPEWPKHVAEYARAVAKRYPWIRFYTPVNEIYITAQFSAAFGWWNERLRSDQAFVTNLKHSVQASRRMMRAILDEVPGALFIFSESTEYVHPGSPALVRAARFLNERRFLSLDLLFGHDVSATIYTYLMRSGMTPAEYDSFAEDALLRSHCIMGTDYYVTNEHILRPRGRTVGSGEIYGYYVITRQYYDRYRVPVMHTETNRERSQATIWLWKQWMNLLRLREDGVPIIGFTWYGLVDMKDWDSALTRQRGHVNRVGLYSLDRRPRKVALEYQRLVREYAGLEISRTKLPVLTA